MTTPDATVAQDHRVFWIGLVSLVIALLSYALIWSGGFVGLPVAWVLGVVALMRFRRQRSTATLSAKIGVAMATLVVLDAIYELARVAFLT